MLMIHQITLNIKKILKLFLQKILIKLDQGSKTISVECTLRIDTINELQYYKSDGILNFVLRNILKN